MNDIEVNIITQTGHLYAQPLSSQLNGQTGFLGVLHGSIEDPNPPSWTGADLVSCQEELNAVLSTLRSNIFPDLSHEERKVFLRVDTPQLACCLRVNPEEGTYHLYCYQRRWLDHHMEQARRGIRFITPNYTDKFSLQDGDMVRIQDSDGTYRDHVCRYIDDCHLELTHGLYHICQFAEIMERNGRTVIPLRASLPQKCFAALETTGEMIIITRDESGYTPTGQRAEGVSPQEGADILNDLTGVTKAQAAAMLAGSMFGWDTPAADPKNYDEQGQPIKPKCRDRGDAR